MSSQQSDWMSSINSEVIYDGGPLYDDRAAQKKLYTPSKLTDFGFLPESIPLQSSGPSLLSLDPESYVEEYFNYNSCFHLEEDTLWSKVAQAPEKDQLTDLNWFADLLQATSATAPPLSEEYIEKFDYDPLVISYYNEFTNLCRDSSPVQLIPECTPFNIPPPASASAALEPFVSSFPEIYTQQIAHEPVVGSIYSDISCSTSYTGELASSVSTVSTSEFPSPKQRKNKKQNRCPSPYTSSSESPSSSGELHPESSPKPRTQARRAQDLDHDDLGFIRKVVEPSTNSITGERVYNVYCDQRGKPVYECPTCIGKYNRTYSKSDLFRHLSSATHSIKQYQCSFPECDKVYTTGDALARHQKDKH